MAPARFQLYRVATARPSLDVAWRFVASNNREVARSAPGQVGEDEARDLIATLQRELAATKASVHLDTDGRWRWDVRLGGRRLVTSSRPYFRRVECDATLTQFLRACPDAPVSTSVAVFRHVAAPPIVLPEQRGRARLVS